MTIFRLHHEWQRATGAASADEHSELAGARRGIAALVVLGALALLLALAVAGCGLTTAGTGGTDTGDTGGSAATPAAGGSCGTVSSGPRAVQNTPAAVTAETCFSAAFAQCRTATLVFTMGGVDTITTHKLTVVSAGGGCHITDARQTTLTGSGRAGPTSTLTCTAATQETSGLRISGCQNGQDFTVAGTSGPVPVLSPVPQA